MGIFITILKIAGIILIVLLFVIIALILLVLFAPVRYKINAAVADPQQHEKFPAEVIRQNFSAQADIGWLLNIVKVRISYPHPETGLLILRVFGRQIDLSKLKRGKEGGKKERPDEEQISGSVSEKLRKIADRIETVCNKADYYWRVVSGSCGRRAFSKIFSKAALFCKKSPPDEWSVCGTAGLGDPYRSGKIAEVTAVMEPFCAGHINIAVDWEAYRLDLKINVRGRVRGIHIAGAVLPLLFDKDCRKLIRKFRAAGKRDFTPQGMHERALQKDLKNPDTGVRGGSAA